MDGSLLCNTMRQRCDTLRLTACVPGMTNRWSKNLFWYNRGNFDRIQDNFDRHSIFGQNIDLLRFCTNFHVFSMIFWSKDIALKLIPIRKHLSPKSVFSSQKPCQCQILGQDMNLLRFYTNFYEDEQLPQLPTYLFK